MPRSPSFFLFLDFLNQKLGKLALGRDIDLDFG